jgi:hypothetical protein
MERFNGASNPDSHAVVDELGDDDGAKRGVDDGPAALREGHDDAHQVIPVIST